MTLDISATSPRVQYTVGSVSTTTFAYGFPIFQEADLKVYIDSTLKELTTDYTITGEGTTSGGNVVLGTGVTNCTVTIYRDITISRTTDFPTSGAFQVGSLNTELDTITAVQQELEDKIARSLRLDDADSSGSMTLPLKASRLGKYLVFNSTTGLPEAGPSESTTAVQLPADLGTVTTSTSDVDYILVADGTVLKKITVSNLGLVTATDAESTSVAMAIALG